MKKLWLVLFLIGFHWKGSAMEPNIQPDQCVKTLTFGNHKLELSSRTGRFSTTQHDFGNQKLEIYDRTGIFSVSQRYAPVTPTQKILFDYTLDGEYPLRIEHGIFNEGIDQLTPLLHFSDTIIFKIDHIKDESIIQIMEIDARGNTTAFYHCPKNKEFHTYFATNNVYKRHFRIEKFKYHLIPHIPDSLFFVKNRVKKLLKYQFYEFMENDLQYDDNEISNKNLKVFYNRHGIILNLDGYDLDYFPLSVDAIRYGLQRGKCLYMNPTDYGITLKKYALTTYYNYKLRLFQVSCKKTLSSLSLIFTKDRCFLNGEPANIMSRDEVLELWGNCSSFLS